MTDAPKLQQSAAIRAPRCDGCKHLWWISAGSIILHSYLDGGLRFVDARDVAEYLDACRAGTPA